MKTRCQFQFLKAVRFFFLAVLFLLLPKLSRAQDAASGVKGILNISGKPVEIELIRPQYDANGKLIEGETKTKDETFFYDTGEVQRKNIRKANNTGSWVEESREYYKSGKIKSEMILLKKTSDPSEDIKKRTSYYENGNIKEESVDKQYRKSYYLFGQLEFEENVASGQQRSYYENGVLKYESEKAGDGIERARKLYYPSGLPDKEEVFDNVELLPGARESYPSLRKIFWENGNLRAETVLHVESLDQAISNGKVPDIIQSCPVEKRGKKVLIELSKMYDQNNSFLGQSESFEGTYWKIYRYFDADGKLEKDGGEMIVERLPENEKDTEPLGWSLGPLLIGPQLFSDE